MLGKECVFSNLATILFETAGFVGAESVAVPVWDLAQVPVAEFSTVKDVELGVELINTDERLNWDVVNPVTVTVWPDVNPWLDEVLYVTIEPEDEASIIVAEDTE